MCVLSSHITERDNKCLCVRSPVEDSGYEFVKSVAMFILVKLNVCVVSSPGTDSE